MPSLASTWIIISEDIHDLSGSSLSGPYQTYKEADMFEYFVPASYQFKKSINVGGLFFQRTSMVYHVQV